MSMISFDGIASGLDTKKIISQLMSLERRPIKKLDTQKTGLETKVSALQELNSKLMALKTRSEALNESDALQSVTVTSDNEDILTLSGGGSSNTGTFAIEVTQLAQNHQISSDSKKDATTELGYSGNIQINDETVEIDATDSLNDIRNKINAANAGVSTSILKIDEDNYKLIFTSNTTGSDGEIELVDDNHVLKNLGIVNGSGKIKNQQQAAQDAEIKVGSENPNIITRSTNTVSDVIDGVTLNLKAAEIGTKVNITLGADNEAVKESIQGFADAYNEVMSYISEKSDYDADSKTYGPLSRDTTARLARSTLRNHIISRASGISGSFTALSQIGITSSASDGTLSIDDTKLTTALTSLNDVQELFTTLTDGLTTRIEDFTDSYDGFIAKRIDNTENSINRVQNRMDAMEVRVGRREERLRSQFQAMETMLMQLQTQGLFLAQQSSSMLGFGR